MITQAGPHGDLTARAGRGTNSRVPVLLPHPRRLEPLSGTHVPARQDGRPPIVQVDPAVFPMAQGYRLQVEPERILIEAHDVAGAFHASQTLKQLRRQAGPAGELACLRIEDWPDFAVRGVLLDISRDKVPTMETLYAWVETLAEWKINQLQLYIEHTFAYRNHRVVWERASPMTAEQIASLDAFCRERFIELVPNQNSFGHMERWLNHPRYDPLAEVPMTGEPGASLEAPGYRSLCPVDERSIDLLSELYAELLPCFTSWQFNVGCDETLDLGKGRSREASALRGVGRVYLDFLLRIDDLVRRHGRTMQFWGDIILNHPELIPELPRDVIALNWGYEADHPFLEEGRRFAESGVPHYVCPGTSAWLSLAGRTENALGNLRSAVASGAVHGAIGCLITDWGDYGHWQPLPASYAPLAFGAAVSWSAETNRELDLAPALDLHVFQDSAGEMGRIALDLGNAYREPGVLLKNASVLALLLLFPERALGQGRWAALTAEGLERAEAYVDGVLSRLGGAAMSRADAGQVSEEFAHAGDLLRHACRLGRERLAAEGHAVALIPIGVRRGLAEELERITGDFRRLWLQRNRPGGLEDSSGRLEQLLGLYGVGRALG